ncbi:MAG: periplasmic heavy metal sensor [Arenimonas sp.]
MKTENFESTTTAKPAKRLQRVWLSTLFAASLAVASIAAIAHEAGTKETVYAQVDLKHLHKITYHLMDRAEPAQKAAIENLVKTAKPELEALNQRALTAKQRKVELLLQDNMDIRAFEQASAEEIKAADELSQRIDEALVDLAKIMTPEQRARLRAHVSGHHG